jgi:VanZ family protein
MPPTTQRNYRLVVAALAVYWLAMFAGTHYPKLPELAQANDELLHFSGYLGLAVLLVSWWQLSPLPQVKRPARIIGAAILILAAYGAFDELTQILAGRDCEFFDWVADVSGGALGALLATTAFSAWRRLRPLS